MSVAESAAAIFGFHDGWLKGYLRKDPAGRIYIDTCASEEEHLTAPLPAGQERRTCRKYLDDILPIPEAGRQVTVRYDIRIQIHPKEES